MREESREGHSAQLLGRYYVNTRSGNLTYLRIDMPEPHIVAVLGHAEEGLGHPARCLASDANRSRSLLAPSVLCTGERALV